MKAAQLIKNTPALKVTSALYFDNHSKGTIVFAPVDTVDELVTTVSSINKKTGGLSANIIGVYSDRRINTKIDNRVVKYTRNIKDVTGLVTAINQSDESIAQGYMALATLEQRNAVVSYLDLLKEINAKVKITTPHIARAMFDYIFCEYPKQFPHHNKVIYFDLRHYKQVTSNKEVTPSFYKDTTDMFVLFLYNLKYNTDGFKKMDKDMNIVFFNGTNAVRLTPAAITSFGKGDAITGKLLQVITPRQKTAEALLYDVLTI